MRTSRWIAVVIVVGFVAGGCFSAGGERGAQGDDSSEADTTVASDVDGSIATADSGEDARSSLDAESSGSDSDTQVGSEDAGTDALTCESGAPRTFFPDEDEDGFGNGDAQPRRACSRPSSKWSEKTGDCNDQAKEAKPTGTETCDGLDNDCDGHVDGWKRRCPRVSLVGTKHEDLFKAVEVADGGAIYAVGRSEGTFGSDANSGKTDALIVRFDRSQKIQWARLLGTSEKEIATDLAIGPEKHLYVTGKTEGALGGSATAPGTGAGFVAKFTPDGDRKWLTQLDMSSYISRYRVAVDEQGASYVVGTVTSEFETEAFNAPKGFLARINPQGDYDTVQFSGGDSAGGKDSAEDVIVVGDSIYVAGATSGDGAFGSPNGANRTASDGYVGRFRKNTDNRWTTRFEHAGEDAVTALDKTPQGEILAVGTAKDEVGGKRVSKTEAIFATAFQPDGRHGLFSLLESTGDVFFASVAADTTGSFYISAETNGKMQGTAPKGNRDSVLAKFDPNQQFDWLEVLGTPGFEQAGTVAVGPDGYVFTVGTSDESLKGAENAGGYDAYVAW